MTLDANIKQCVVPPPAQSPDTTGSLPSPAKPAAQSSPPPLQQTPAPQIVVQPKPQPIPAEAQQPQFQEKRADIPIEQVAAIKPDSQIADTAVEFAHFVRGSGYRCDSISALAQRAATFILTCNRSAFRYSINKDNDGRWIVALQ
jgi:LAS superfamily LD-carboxypeptidase LdcB